MKIKNYFKVLPLVLITLLACNEEEEINLAPVITNQTLEVLENIESGLKFGSVVASDPENDQLVFKIKENDADLFLLSEEGELAVAMNKSLDYETKGIHKLIVEVSDGTQTASAEISIKVKDVDETPVINNQVFTVVENVSATHVIGTIIATDPNNDVLTYRISSKHFEISNSGELSLIEGKELDFETKEEYSFIVEASDGTHAATAEVTINVTDENEVPVMENQTFTVAEDLTATQIIGKVVATDVDGDEVRFSMKLNDKDIFRISVEGDLKLSPRASLDYETKTEHQITVEVSDGSLTTTAEIIINVTDVEEDPVVHIPDDNFKKALIVNTSLNTNNDTEIQESEAESYVGRLIVSNYSISDLTGIEYFPKVTQLYFSNNKLSNVDLSKNVNLEVLFADGNSLSSLDVSKNVKLKSLVADTNQLLSIDVTKNPLLEIMMLRENELTSLDISQNTKLRELYLSNNKITAINTSNNPYLAVMVCKSNKLSSLNLSNNARLQSLNVSQNLLTGLNVSNNLSLSFLDCSYNSLTNLDIEDNSALRTLFAAKNQLTTVTLPNSYMLNEINLQHNQISTIDVTKITHLKIFKLDYNELFSVNLSKNINLTNVSITKNSKLVAIHIANGNNRLVEYFNVSENPNLMCIQIDNTFEPNPSKWIKDSTAGYNYTTCP
ncbi:conserved protein of unknown function [Tenacibaculum sp. 190130A14a]|uniref:Cadherin domain-containing protein n=1 Tax=Tenacibaculum polynesiense TaxID=3137857 RepID=A0ABP1F1Q4_9FLAO